MFSAEEKHRYAEGVAPEIARALILDQPMTPFNPASRVYYLPDLELTEAEMADLCLYPQYMGGHYDSLILDDIIGQASL